MIIIIDEGKKEYTYESKKKSVSWENSICAVQKKIVIEMFLIR